MDFPSQECHHKWILNTGLLINMTEYLKNLNLMMDIIFKEINDPQQAD